MYDSLLSKFRNTAVFQADASRLIQSVPVPLSFLNEVSYDKCRTAPCRHITSSLADHFVGSAVEYMLYESGIESASLECIRTLSQAFRSCVCNLGRVLSSSVLSFPAEEESDSSSRRRYVCLLAVCLLVQPLSVASQFHDDPANTALRAASVYARTTQCL